MSRKFPHPFGEFKKRYATFKRTLPAIVSNIALNDFKDNFKRQGVRTGSGMTIKWRKRKHYLSNRKDRGRALLVKTGRLRRSLRAAPLPGVARVVTNVPYAQAHNEGANNRVQVQAHTRARYGTVKFMRKKGKGFAVYSAGSKQYIKQVDKNFRRRKFRAGTGHVRAHHRKMNIPARPFMITTQPLLNDIDTHIANQLDRLFSSI